MQAISMCITSSTLWETWKITVWTCRWQQKAWTFSICDSSHYTLSTEAVSLPSSLLFSPAPLTLFRFLQLPTGGLLAKMKGFLCQWSFLSSILFAMLQSLPVSPCLPLSIHPSCSPPLHIYLSLPQVGELIPLSSWKKAASGDKHWNTGLSVLLF